MAAQLGLAFDNLETVLSRAGFALSDLVRLNYYTTDADLLMRQGEVIAGRLAPAGVRASSTLLEVRRLAFPELLVEIEATAVA